MNPTLFTDLKEHRVTSRQVDTLRYVYWHQLDFGYPPTLREMCEAFGIKSSYAAHCRVRQLERHGYLSHKPKQARSWLVTEKGKRVLGVSTDPWPFTRVEKEEG